MEGEKAKAPVFLRADFEERVRLNDYKYRPVEVAAGYPLAPLNISSFSLPSTARISS